MNACPGEVACDFFHEALALKAPPLFSLVVPIGSIEELGDLSTAPWLWFPWS